MEMQAQAAALIDPVRAERPASLRQESPLRLVPGSAERAAFGNIVFPRHYRGIYEQVGKRHAALLAEARRELYELPIPDDLRPAFAYQTWDNPQPSFILFPLMYLATAEASGGITRQHIDYLPMILLFSELLAVADDTLDRSSTRSGRQTFAHRCGDPAALSLCSALVAILMKRSLAIHPRLFEEISLYFTDFFSLELWEAANLYPDFALFDAWISHRHDQAILSTQFVLDSALILSGQPTWPKAAVQALNRIAQDVDDIVNIVEFRERTGENDDLLSGIVTRPLVHAVRRRLALGDEVKRLWSLHRPLAEQRLSIAEFQARRAPLLRQSLHLYRPVRDEILREGVPPTIRGCLADLRESVRLTPQPLQPLMRALASGFISRLRSCGLAEAVA